MDNEREKTSLTSPAPQAGGSPAPRFRYDYATGAGAKAAVSTLEKTRQLGGPAMTWGDASVVVGLGLVFLAVFILLFRLNFKDLTHLWSTDASWSHGFVVPLLSGMLIYLQWDKIQQLPLKGTKWGLALAAYGVASHILFRVTGTSHMSNLSMLVVLFGATLFILGWDYLKVLWLPICYLLFMINPPSTLYVKITTPMQNIAATVGGALLPLFGVTSEQSGTVIQVLVNGHMERMNVEEACSGIRMLLAFVALAVVLAYSTPRPMWQKFFLACCAAPVAILCNALRVTLTGVFFVQIGKEATAGATHEYLGFFMLIPAMLLQLGIAWVLDRIFVEEPEETKAPAAEVGT